MRGLPIPLSRLLPLLCSFKQKRVKRIIDGKGSGGECEVLRSIDGKRGGGDVRSFGALMEREGEGGCAVRRTVDGKRGVGNG